MFTKLVSSFHPATVRIIFIHCMERVGIIITQEKELWKTRRGGQITNNILRDNRYGIWEHIWGRVGYFMRAGYIINGNGG